MFCFQQKKNNNFCPQNERIGRRWCAAWERSEGGWIFASKIFERGLCMELPYSYSNNLSQVPPLPSPVYLNPLSNLISPPPHSLYKVIWWCRYTIIIRFPLRRSWVRINSIANSLPEWQCLVVMLNSVQISQNSKPTVLRFLLIMKSTRDPPL